MFAEGRQQQFAHFVRIGFQRQGQGDADHPQGIAHGDVAYVLRDELGVGHDHRGAVGHLDFRGSHVDPTDVPLDPRQAHPVPHLDRTLSEQDQARDKVLHDLLQAKTDTHRQGADHPGEAGEVDAQGRHHQHGQEQEAQVTDQGHQGGAHAGIHVRLRQQALAQPALDHTNGEQTAQEHGHGEQDVLGHDVQVAEQLATGVVPVRQAQQQLARAGARGHEHQQGGDKQQERATDPCQDRAGLGLVALLQPKRGGQGQATGLAWRKQGFAQIAEHRDQQVGAGAYHTDPQQLGGEEVGQGQVTGEQRQQDQRDPHHDHERDQPRQPRCSLQLMLLACTAVAHQRRDEDQRHHQRGQAIGGQGERKARADHAVDALLGQQHHQGQGQELGEPAQGAGHLVRDRRQPPGRALEHQHGAAKAGDEGTEDHQRQDVVDQAGNVVAQLCAVLQAPAHQRHRATDGTQGRQADTQSQRAAAQAAFRQPADHGIGQQAFEQAANPCPDQQRGRQAADEQPTVIGTEGTGHGVGRLATQIAQTGDIFVGRADQARPERRAQGAGGTGGDLGVELAAAQVDDLSGQVACRLGQLDGLLLLGQHLFLLVTELLALTGDAFGFVREHRAEDLELIVQALHIGGALGAQGIGLSLHLQGGLTQLRQQVVVGFAGQPLANLVKPIAQLLQAGVFLQHRQLVHAQWPDRCRPGRCRHPQQQGEDSYAKTAKAQAPHRIPLFTSSSLREFYAAPGDHVSAVSRSSNCRLRSTPQR